MGADVAGKERQPGDARRRHLPLSVESTRRGAGTVVEFSILREAIVDSIFPLNDAN
jgi:hypothetical protein